MVEREARPQHLALIAVAEGVEGGAVDAVRTVGMGVGRWSFGSLPAGGRPSGAARRRRRTGRRPCPGPSPGEPRRRVLAMPSAASRSSSCSAALRLKASMRMPEGSVPRSTSSTTRLTSVLVLPDPAGASTRAGPHACSTAARWASSSRTASGPLAGVRRGATPGGVASGAPAPGRAPPGAAVPETGSSCGRPRSLGRRPGSLRRRPMSSRSSREESPTARLRGWNTSAPKGKPRQYGSPRASSGWTKRRRISVACASNSSRVPVQYQSPAAGSPPSRERRGSPGASVQPRREAKRTPGAAAAASRASSLRDATPKKTSPGRVAAGAAGSRGWGPAAVVLTGGPVSVAAFTAEEASRHPRPRRG